jgi:hypothetical protein
MVTSISPSSVASRNSIALSVKRLTGFLYHGATVVLLVEAVVLLARTVWPIYLTQGQRQLAFVIGALPGLSLVLSVYLVEGLAANVHLAGPFFRRSIGSLLLILLPPAAIVDRYIDDEIFHLVAPAVGVGVLAWIFSVVWMSYHRTPHSVMGQLLWHTKLVMNDIWKHVDAAPESLSLQERHDRPERIVDLGRIRSVRTEFYTYKQGLTEFQATISCQELDAQEASRLIPDSWNPHSVSVLDVGGGDGEFTCHLLQNLRHVRPSSITLLDPIDWSKEYKKSITSLNANPTLRYQRVTFEDFTTLEPQDLIIASHSLYSPCDALNRDPKLIAQVVIQKLVEIKKAGGYIVLVLASTKGVSYHFKSLALSRLHGLQLHDTTAEVLEEALANTQNTGLRYQRKIVDNIFDLTAVMRSKDRLKNWCSYFLRADVVNLSDDYFGCLEDDLKTHTVSLGELSESDIQRYKRVSRLTLNDNSVILPHKTVVFVLS